MLSHRVLDTVHVALGTHALYHYLIDMSGNLLGSLEVNIIWYVASHRCTGDLTKHLSLQEHEGTHLHGVLS